MEAKKNHWGRKARCTEPNVFSQFQLLGRVPARIWDDNLGLQPTGTLPFVPAKPACLHRDQLPLDRDVVRFSP